MMKKIIYPSVLLVFTAFLFMGSSGGFAISMGEGITGAPGDVKQANGNAKTCQFCHNGGTYNASTKIELLNEAGTAAVTRYEPTKNYTIRVTVTPGAGAPVGYGFQMIDIRKSNSANVKGFLAQQPSGIRITNLTSGAQANRVYAEHDSWSVPNIFSVKWKAPAAGTGAVVFYAVGNAVNGNNSTSGDNGTASVNVEFAELTSNVNELANAVEMVVYPNPTTEGVSLQIVSKKSQLLQVRISDISGKTIVAENWSLQVGDNNRKLNVANLPKGAYMVQLVDNQDIVSKKIIKL
jgi:hypothetical protein